MDLTNLVGRVVRLHSHTEPNKAKLYLITNEEYDSYSQGKVTETTVRNWIKEGLLLTFYTA